MIHGFVINMFNPHHPPIKTVGYPKTIVPPCAVASPILAAGFPQINTVADPSTIESAGPTQTALSPKTAAGIFPINTVGAPGPTIGPPTCGMGGCPAVTIGQVCISVSLAAGAAIVFLFIFLIDHYNCPFKGCFACGRKFG
jgi:hypothetical protein